MAKTNMKNKTEGKITKAEAVQSPTFGSDDEFEEVRLGLDIRTLNEENPTIRGIFLGVDVLKDAEGNPKINAQYGNEMEYAKFRDLRSEDEFGVWMDGGLKGSISFNQVKPGMAVRVTYTGRKEVETIYGAKDIKQYDIRGLQPKGTQEAKAS